MKKIFSSSLIAGMLFFVSSAAASEAIKTAPLPNVSNTCSYKLMLTYEYNGTWSSASVQKAIDFLYSEGCLEVKRSFQPNNSECKAAANTTNEYLSSLNTRLVQAEKKYKLSFPRAEKLLRKSALLAGKRNPRLKRKIKALNKKAGRVINQGIKALQLGIKPLRPKADKVMFLLLDSQAKGCARLLPQKSPQGAFEKAFKRNLAVFETANQLEIDRYYDWLDASF